MDRYIKRDLEEIILHSIKTPEIIAVIGPRQSGKSTLVEHIFEGLPQSHQLTLEDASLFSLFEEDIKTFASLHVEGYCNVFIDEIQYAPSLGKNMKYLFHFWHSKSKAKVDFVAKQNHSVIPIEVKAGHPQITRSFRSFIQRYAPEKAFVVNSEVQEQGKIEATLVRKIFFSEMVDMEKLIM